MVGMSTTAGCGRTKSSSWSRISARMVGSVRGHFMDMMGSELEDRGLNIGQDKLLDLLRECGAGAPLNANTCARPTPAIIIESGLISLKTRNCASRAGLGLRHHLHSNEGWFSVPVLDHRCLFAQGNGLPPEPHDGGRGGVCLRAWHFRNGPRKEADSPSDRECNIAAPTT